MRTPQSVHKSTKFSEYFKLYLLDVCGCFDRIYVCIPPDHGTQVGETREADNLKTGIREGYV